MELTLRKLTVRPARPSIPDRPESPAPTSQLARTTSLYCCSGILEKLPSRFAGIQLDAVAERGVDASVEQANVLLVKVDRCLVTENQEAAKPLEEEIRRGLGYGRATVEA